MLHGLMLHFFAVWKLGAHFQVFQHRHCGENLSTFRNTGDAAFDDVRRCCTENVFIVKGDLPVPGSEDAGDRF